MFNESTDIDIASSIGEASRMEAANECLLVMAEEEVEAGGGGGEAEGGATGETCGGARAEEAVPRFSFGSCVVLVGHHGGVRLSHRFDRLGPSN